MMNIKLRSLLLAILLTTVMGINFVSAQTTQTATAGNDPLAALPASDVIGFVNLRRIMTEVIPRIFANDPATLAKMTMALDEANKKTGINILSVDRIVAGMRFYGTSFNKVEKEDVGIVIVVHGDFDPNAFLAAVKRETKGKGTEETYGGKVIYHEPMPAPPKKRAERETPAVVILDANTIAVGDLPQIRAAIDAAAGNGRVDPALVQLATRNSDALVGSAVNVPEAAKQSFLASGPKEEMPPGIDKIINGIKQIYVSLGANPTAFNISLGARFESAEQVQSVSDMLTGLRQQALSQVPDQQTRALIESVQITAQGDELKLRTDIKNEVVQGLAIAMLKENKPSPKVSPGKAKPTTKSRKTRRRRRR